MKKNMVLAIIQARMGSKRLPGKMMKEIMGKPLIHYIVERVMQCRNADEIVVATSDNKKDDSIEEFCRENKIKVFRGSEENVLERFYKCAKQNEGKIIIRICGDSPLIDPDFIDEMIERFKGCDYLTNALKPFVPKGLDFEIFSFDALEKTYKKAQTKEEKEHVTKYIYEHKKEFKIKERYPGKIFYRPEIKLTVDTKRDFDVIERILQEIYPKNALFRTSDILSVLDKKPGIYTGSIKRTIRMIIRVDGSRAYGFGHFNRCRSLFKELKKIKALDISFVLKKYEGYEKAIEMLSGEKYLLIEKNLSFKEEIEFIKSRAPEFVICDLDYRTIDDNYFKMLAENFKAIVIDDMGFNKINSEVIINESIVEKRQKYNASNSTIVYAGPKYMILKKEFGEYNKKKKIISNKSRELLISLGGADPNNNLERILDIIKSSKNNVRIKVIAGKTYRNIDKIMLKFKDIMFLLDIDNMYELMYDSDMIICNGGVTLYEANCIGVPSIVIPQNIEEEGTGKRFEEHGSCILIKKPSKENLTKALQIPEEQREEMSKKGKALVDGYGLVRVSNIILFIIANAS